MTRYLLKRFGFSPKQSKQFFYALRLGYMRQVLFDLRAPGLEARPLNDSDVRMVEMGMSQLSLAAVKLRKREVGVEWPALRCIDADVLGASL